MKEAEVRKSGENRAYMRGYIPATIELVAIPTSATSGPSPAEAPQQVLYSSGNPPPQVPMAYPANYDSPQPYGYNFVPVQPVEIPCAQKIEREDDFSKI
jgi:hypothetical protein